jgi:hypothetical protein
MMAITDNVGQTRFNGKEATCKNTLLNRNNSGSRKNTLSNPKSKCIYWVYPRCDGDYGQTKNGIMKLNSTVPLG